MELVSINPKNRYKEMFKQDIVMCLSHLVLKDPEYASMAHKSKAKIIYVDNSIVELGSAVSIENIIKAAEMVGVEKAIPILEDAYPSGPKTIEAIKKNVSYIKENHLENKFKNGYMAVIHGENLEDFKKTLEYVETIDFIKYIGIPKVLSVWAGDRANLFEYFKNTSKKIHFLGTWYNLGEIIKAPKEVHDKVVSVDTCLPSYYIVSGKSIYENRDGTIDLEKDYNEITKAKYNSMLKYIKKEIKINYKKNRRK